VGQKAETFDSLETALRATGFAWSLTLVGEDQGKQLLHLIRDLRRPFSESGDGKRIVSGFSYWGTEPTYAWARACSDPLYPVMRESIQSFARRWGHLSAEFLKAPFHYVSLGPGTGEKDGVILRSLSSARSQLRYLPLDMSTDMLQKGATEVIRDARFPDLQILPVQLDFSDAESISNFRSLLDVLIRDEPVLFSLLGNTLANFDDDDKLLKLLNTSLLNPEDRLLLEVATTNRLDETSARRAADEYWGSNLFCDFVTSALLHRTDLRIDLEGEALAITGSVDSDASALTVKMLYRNISGSTIRVVLGDRSAISFLPNDTIRLYLTRKYLPEGLDKMLAEANLDELKRTPYTYSASPFGLELLLLKTREEGERRLHDVFKRA
jgi:L-histidine N-alpha-methyltransferase